MTRITAILPIAKQLPQHFPTIFIQFSLQFNVCTAMNGQIHFYTYICSVKQIVNRKAKFEYQFIRVYEAGIVLRGTEVKSIKAGEANLNDAYCLFVNGELILKSMYVAEYDHGNINNHEPRADRKLLLRRAELKKIEGKAKEKGFAIVPYKLYLSERNQIKVEIATAQGKKSYDKSKSIKERDAKRDLDRVKKDYKL